MKWFHQHRLGGLGNFIMATPALQLLFERDGQKINVFFDAPYISKLYSRCPFINILRKKPGGKPFSTSVRPKRKNKSESDSEAMCRILLGNSCNQIPNTYIDNYISKKLDKKEGVKYVAVFHGCLGGFKPKKDIGRDIRQFILHDIYKLIIIIRIICNSHSTISFWFIFIINWFIYIYFCCFL